jgi:hypothetical protein
MKATKSIVKGTRHVVKSKKIMKHFNRFKLGARVDLFIVEDQGSYYNIVTDLN